MAMLYRSSEIDSVRSSSKDRIVATLSSETPVERHYGLEVLDHSPGSVDMNRAKDGLPLLWSHDPQQVVGRVENIRLEGRKLKGDLRPGNTSFAREVWADIQDKVVTDLSVGYALNDSPTKEGDGVYRFRNWQPQEVSAVAVPADPAAKIGRSMNVQSRRKNPMADKDINTTSEQIRELAKQHNAVGLGERCIREGMDLQQFQHELLTVRYNAKSAEIDTRGAGPLIGMSDKEIKRYSLTRAIYGQATGEKLDGIEREASDEVARIAGRKSDGFFLPQDIMGRAGRINLSERAMDLLGPRGQERMIRAMGGTRALDVVPSTAGGFNVDSQVLGSELIELLRNIPKVAEMGARTLTGLTGNVLLPRATGAATAYWLPPSGAVTASQQAFGQLALTPKRLVADTAYSKELIIQSSADVEAYVREDMMIVLAIAQDLAAINGLGANGQPVGISNTTGIKTETFGGAATWAKIVDMETQVAGANVRLPGPACGYLVTTNTRGKWKTATKIASSQYSSFLWDTGANGGGLVNGYRAEATNQIPSDKVIFGNWNDLIIASWAGIDVVVDPYSLKKSGQIEVTITLWTDIGIRHPVSFCMSTDSGAQ